MDRREWIGATLASAFAGRVGAADPVLPPIEDLPALAREIGGRRVPLLILFSTPGCPYCLEVRRNYLHPRLTEAAGDLVIREVDMTSARSLLALDGSRTTEAAFAARYGVRVAPVVMLFDSNFQLLGEPLVGLDRSGFYEARLQSAIESARVRLRATR